MNDSLKDDEPEDEEETEEDLVAEAEKEFFRVCFRDSFYMLPHLSVLTRLL